VVGMVTAASAATPSLTRVSESPDGTLSGGGSVGPGTRMAVSDNGRYVAFESSSSLDSGDTNKVNDVYLKDMQTGTLTRVSVSTGKALANSSSGGDTVDISNDGRYVLFSSNASNLVTGDTNANGDLFMYDRQTGNTERILRSDGLQSISFARQGSLSGNGRYVAFSGRGYDGASGSNDAGTFVWDRTTKMTERLTDGPNFTGVSETQFAAISDDGRYVAFVTSEFNHDGDVILFDRNADTWEVANPRIGGAAPVGAQVGVSISGNGRFVAFGSSATNYVSGDTANTNDVFVYDSNPNSLERIPANKNANRPYPALSDDGRYVTFTDWTDLYGAANGRADVIFYDRQTDQAQILSLNSDGSPADRNSGSFSKGAINGDARFVAFSSQWNFDTESPAATNVWLTDREGITAPPGECNRFSDVDSSNVFISSICWLAAQGITLGCNPPANTKFCPKDKVTRGQMAAFLVRALGYSDNGGGNLFIDDDDSIFESAIDKLGTAGVTKGCNPPANTEFCPKDNVTRGQMAAFLVRALGYSDNGGGNLFIDDNDSVFEGAIDRLGTARVTLGCNPPANTKFCPKDSVTREQMAAFLKRALG
jgi:hypothetical protein